MNQQFVNRVLSGFIKGYLLYRENDHIWIINPDKDTWVISVSDSGYTFYNHLFFEKVFNFMSVISDNEIIADWIRNDLGINVNEHCYPDFVSGDYDWTKDFDIKNVIQNGDVISKPY